MSLAVRVAIAALFGLLSLSSSLSAEDPASARLPDGVKAVWDLDKAHRERAPTRERVSINGLWRWQPARTGGDEVPQGNWGYFKVPGCWPGITDYLQKDSQTLYAHPGWKDERLGETAASWYQREITIPAEWRGRRIVLTAEYVNSRARVDVDGKRAGEILFPAGELDLTPLCQPGQKHLLSLYVAAVPLHDVLLSAGDTNAPREVRGRVARRGLCGDVFLAGVPAGPRIGAVKVDTSVRNSEITFDVPLSELAADARYSLVATIKDPDRAAYVFKSESFLGRDLKTGRFSFSARWKPEKLWDIHTPQNLCELSLALLDSDGKTLDTSFGERFGFREFTIEGKDFYLNGKRVFLSAVPVDNAQISAALATYEAAKETFERLKSFGINFVYTHNYDCQPGAHLSFAEILRAADDAGILLAMSQPHFQHYDWDGPAAEAHNGYARHAEFYVRIAQNHPAVVAYAMSHNATGYSEDMNPDMIDGVTDPRGERERKSVQKPLRAEAIVKRLDPARIVYHHSSGNLSSMHTSNFYPNFVPIQELSDWFEHWATKGAKPVFLCEYGAPFGWDWAMYRGWYQGKREFGSAPVPWDFSLAEWNSQFYGDRAFQISEFEQANLRWEAKKFASGAVWRRWDYPHNLNSPNFAERYPIMAMYLADNWRAFRTWGLSANSPWEYGHYWKLRQGVARGREEFAVDWESLQRPGISPDYLDQRYERMDVAYRREDWEPTEAAQALYRNNRPLLAFIAGKPAAFTSKDHLFVPGEWVQKQAVVINNSRETVGCDCEWSLDLPAPVAGKHKVESLATGDQVRIPLEWKLPESLAPGTYHLAARFRFTTGETQEDSFALHVVPQPPPLDTRVRIAVFDPQGETRTWLDRQGVGYHEVKANEGLAGYDLLIVGKAALTVDGPAPDVLHVRDGLRVLLFEQAPEVLEQRFGFRVAQYGLRQAFARVPDHPLLAGISAENLRDWRGSATLLPPRLTYQSDPRKGPLVKWCDISVPRLWRCGNRGNVASVLIEKPARGDFLPIVDGGYSLQYAPLLEYREGTGMMLFCQLDVTGRSEPDPIAETLARRLVDYAARWKPGPRRSVVYAGEPAGKAHLEAAGFSVAAYERGGLRPQKVLVVGPHGGETLLSDKAAIGQWLRAGGKLLGIGLAVADIDALPLGVGLQTREHIATCFDPPSAKSLLAGVGPADVHNRDPRALPLIASGATLVGDGVLAEARDGSFVLCQMAPWQLGDSKHWNVKKTYRRTSFLISRLLANLGAAGSTPIVARFHAPVARDKPEQRFLEGLYLDQPEEWDDPYRFFRW